MKLRTLATLSPLVISICLGACATAYDEQATSAAQQAKITVLYDAFGKTATMQKTGASRRSLNTVGRGSCSIPATMPGFSPTT